MQHVSQGVGLSFANVNAWKAAGRIAHTDRQGVRQGERTVAAGFPVGHGGPIPYVYNLPNFRLSQFDYGERAA